MVQHYVRVLENYTPLKRQGEGGKTFLGGIEKEHWAKMG